MTLDSQQARTHIDTMIEAALAAADPASAVRRHLQKDGRSLFVGPYRYDLDRGRLFLLSVGKAALTMGRAALQELEGDIAAGVIIGKPSPGAPARRFTSTVGDGRAQVTIYEAGHPVSDENSLLATKNVVDLLQETAPGDLLLCLISGGTSALLTQPVISLEQWQNLTQALLESGCTINELNCVRKQLDRVKGGGLAELAAPASTISLILSDVVGNPLDVIGSGPTAADPDSPAEALSILHRYNIARHVDADTWALITERLTNHREATSLARFSRLEVRNVIVGDVRRAAEAARAAAADLGFQAQMLTAQLEGESREVGRVAAALAKDAPPGGCFILGGETTVTVRGDGLGGRNQELALSAALRLAGASDRVVCTFATDGEDGPTDAAGALVSAEVHSLARLEGLDMLDYLDRNDSHGFFLRLAQEIGRDFLLRPGPTGTNVNDLLFILNYFPS